jgi:D-threonate/D-erythronate kinase
VAKTGLSAQLLGNTGVATIGRLVILADDFTGACDAAGAFAAAGCSTLVALSVDDQHASEVLAVDLNLRERSDTDACSETQAAARRLRADEPGARLFLKIDSTLRGPLAGAIDGALRGSGKDLAVISPAFPEQGRLLQAGRLVIDGQVGRSLTQALGLEGTALLDARLANSSDDVARAVEHAHMRGARRVVVDADGAATLVHVAEAWRSHPEWLVVGSAGLARRLVSVATSREPPQPGAAPEGAVLVVAGSPAPATRVQLDKLRHLGPVVVADPYAAVPAHPAGQHRLLVLCTTLTRQRDEGECAQALATTVSEWAPRVRPSAVILAGGATARLVCERLGARGVCLSGELEPGIPIGHLVGGVWDNLTLVTKAGGFGTPNTLLDAARALGVSSTA